MITEELLVNGRRIVCDRVEGRGDCILFLGGYASDRKSTKASALCEWAVEKGRPFMRFDYSGHGESGGTFITATLGDWLEEALAVFDRATESGERVVVVGSSMGGWLALLVAVRRPEKVKALITIACGADFTEVVVRPKLTPEAFSMLEREGLVYKPAQDGNPATPLTKKFLEEAADHLILGKPIPVACPVRLLHGLNDREVPWRVSAAVLENLEAADATLLLVKGGDHRLSAPADMERLFQLLETPPFTQ